MNNAILLVSIILFIIIHYYSLILFIISLSAAYNVDGRAELRGSDETAFHFSVPMAIGGPPYTLQKTRDEKETRGFGMVVQDQWWDQEQSHEMLSGAIRPYWHQKILLWGKVSLKPSRLKCIINQIFYCLVSKKCRIFAI